MLFKTRQTPISFLAPVHTSGSGSALGLISVTGVTVGTLGQLSVAAVVGLSIESITTAFSHTGVR